MVMVLPGGKQRARVNEMEAQRVRALSSMLRLQKTLRPEPRDRVYDRRCLPPENPAGHRKAYCRITQVHHFHKHPPSRLDMFAFRGGTFIYPIGTIPTS